MAATTISLASPFFIDVRFIQRTEGAGMTPAPELLEYAHAFEWDKETAASKVAPLLAKTWFWEALQPRLAFDKLTEDQVVTLLAEKPTAGPAYKSQLRMILDYLEAAGMIKRENGQVAALKATLTPVSVASPAKATEPEALESVGTPALPRTNVVTNFAQREGAVNFDISVRVDMSEFAGWEPSRIAAFFQGIAQVISAKGMFEKQSLKE